MSSNNQISEFLIPNIYNEILFILFFARSKVGPTVSSASKKNVLQKKINIKVNKRNIRNSENWLLDDVSEIINTLLSKNIQTEQN